MWQMRIRMASALFARATKSRSEASGAATVAGAASWLAAWAADALCSRIVACSAACVFAAAAPSKARTKARARRGALRYCGMRENVIRDRAKKTSNRTSKFHNGCIRISLVPRRYVGYAQDSNGILSGNKRARSGPDRALPSTAEGTSSGARRPSVRGPIRAPLHRFSRSPSTGSRRAWPCRFRSGLSLHTGGMGRLFNAAHQSDTCAIMSRADSGGGTPCHL
jgi:hypothetical protein